MNQKFLDVSLILNESSEPRTPTTPEEKARRIRMLKRAAIMGAVTGAGMTGVELMLHPEARSSILKAAKQQGLMKKIATVGKQVWKPMAVGAGADLAIEPTITHANQKMEDRYQKKIKGKV
jgi:hypothetical protein